ncbi:hypothetical protein B0T25DRAFT_74894 [Lasiosphaeria hispida]|uniref:Uncharacterized protein n=1 Tax=Lasiosphaeria hispida TaxID=260671 RepID=A0AAJ0HPH0_9PEZI|nr:hypothetical protein B0T25DRAFT_74894 [Lasiosphaeria hispida]
MMTPTLWQRETAVPTVPHRPFRCGANLGDAARFQQACRNLDTLRKDYRQNLESQISQLERELKGVRDHREKRTVSAARVRKNRVRKSLSQLPSGLNLTCMEGGTISPGSNWKPTATSSSPSQHDGGASYLDDRASIPMTGSAGDGTSASDSDGAASRSASVGPESGVPNGGRDGDLNVLCSALEGLVAQTVQDEVGNAESPKRRGTV